MAGTKDNFMTNAASRFIYKPQETSSDTPKEETPAPSNTAPAKKETAVATATKEDGSDAKTSTQQSTTGTNKRQAQKEIQKVRPISSSTSADDLTNAALIRQAAQVTGQIEDELGTLPRVRPVSSATSANDLTNAALKRQATQVEQQIKEEENEKMSVALEHLQRIAGDIEQEAQKGFAWKSGTGPNIDLDNKPEEELATTSQKTGDFKPNNAESYTPNNPVETIEETKGNTQPAPIEAQAARQQDAELGKLQRVSPISSAASADSLTNAALKRQADQANADKLTNTINDAYYSPIRDLTNRTSEMLAKRNAIKEQDEVAQRRGRSMKMIAGISDGLAALANLIGVGQGGSHIDLGTGALTPLEKKLEEARVERKADIKSIDDRIEQYRNQLLQMQLAKGTAQAQAQEKAEERAHKTSERLGAQAWQSGEKALDRKTNAAIAAAKIQSTQATAAQNNAFKARLETYRQEQANARAALNAAERGRTGANAPSPIILKGGDGQWYSYDLTKAEKEELYNKIIPVVEDDIEGSPFLADIYEKYKEAKQGVAVGTATQQDVEDLRQMLFEYSPTLNAMVRRGRQGTLVSEVNGAENEETGDEAADNDEFAGNRVG